MEKNNQIFRKKTHTVISKLSRLTIIGVCLFATFVQEAKCQTTFTPGSVSLWENSPVDPRLQSKSKVGIVLTEGRTNIDWDVWGLPLGNGRLGALFYGNLEEELIQFNENSLWSGGNDHENLTDENLSNFGSYQPFGDVHIQLPHTECTDYLRELDLNQGMGKVSYISEGVIYNREYFASYPDQVIVVRLSANAPGSYTGSVKLSDRHFATFTADIDKIISKGKLDSNLYIKSGFSELAYGTPEEIANADRTFAGNNMKYEAQVKVIADGGSLSVEADDELKFTNANSVTIILAAGTDFLQDYSENWRGEDPHAQVTEQIDAASSRTYEELRMRHLEDYQSLFGRFSLELGTSSAEKKSLGMYERLIDYRKNPNDPELLALMAQYGRYLIISSSRPGSMPANLQGLWNPERIIAPWSADYHLNINMQMNYWLTGPGNISECDEPVVKWLNSILPAVQLKTGENHGVRGWAGGWAFNLFGGGGNGKKCEVAWICWHLYENFKFTNDTTTLENYSFRLIQEAVYFWEDMLKEKDGLLLVPDVQSPEWGPTEDGVLYAQEIVWELFTEYVEICDILGKDMEHRNKIAEMRDKLAGPKVGSKGQLMEWQTEDLKLLEKQHRHISHLVGLFPGRQITPLTTPDLAEAAKVTMGYRGMGSTGWSKIHKAVLWARLLDGDETMNLLREFLKLHIMPCGLSAINNNDKFQIDANLAYSAAVFEMLLQSHTDQYHLLPALPSELPDGTVNGIRGRNGFEFDMTWEKGELTEVVIDSTFGGPCKVKYKQIEVTLDIPASTHKKFTIDELKKMAKS